MTINLLIFSEQRVKLIQDIKWMETLAVPPLLKHSPAAKYLSQEYFMDGVGMSPTAQRTDNGQFLPPGQSKLRI